MSDQMGEAVRQLGEAKAEVERLRAALIKLRDAYERHQWSVTQGHDDEPDRGEAFVRALVYAVGVLDVPRLESDAGRVKVDPGVPADGETLLDTSDDQED